MKTSELRALIREEVKKVLKEAKVKKDTSELLSILQDFQKKNQGVHVKDYPGEYIQVDIIANDDAWTKFRPIIAMAKKYKLDYDRNTWTYRIKY